MLNHPNISPWPYYEADEIEAARNTLMSGQVNYWTGDIGKKFESQYAKSVGKNYGIALSNGTVALELALRVLGIEEGDEVIVTSRSYVASASCVVLLGAIPVFADVDLVSGNISVETIAPLITSKTKAIIPVHIGGWPCDMIGIMALAEQHNLMVIEDCAQAHGASIEGKAVGAWGHASIFSFCQDKIISTGGEGGMLLLDEETYFKKAWAYKDIGRSYDAVFHRQHPAGFRWLTETAGSNFRMTEFQAAIGLVQLAKLPKWIEKRNEHAEAIIEVLKPFDFLNAPTFINKPGNLNAYYRLYAIVREEYRSVILENETLRDFIVNQLVSAGVPCFFGACAEVYREKLFVDAGYQPKLALKNAHYFSNHAFCFLVHHTITTSEIQHITTLIKHVLAGVDKSIKFK
ncbi:MAG: DegT/DnrJ/EryC1/StrS family aminotransferase [Methylotenera sp.]|nr:DegT/DnrJ/EryC1/StrS family aminotransferase [Methylotenera sp.]